MFASRTTELEVPAWVGTTNPPDTSARTMVPEPRGPKLQARALLTAPPATPARCCFQPSQRSLALSGRVSGTTTCLQAGEVGTAAVSPRQIFAEQLMSLFAEAGNPTLATVATEMTRKGAVGVTDKRLSTWRLGHHLPRWHQLQPLLLCLFGRIKPVANGKVAERYQYPFWRFLLEEAESRDGRRSTATKARTALANRVHESTITEPQCPYRGLTAYDTEDEHVFFGRDDDTTKLLDTLAAAVRTGGITVLSGHSGVGKSSLLRAGLVPALRKGELPGSSTWPVVFTSPGQDPLAALCREVPELAEALELSGHARIADVNAATLAERVCPALRAHAARSTRPGTVTPRLLLIVDAFEELFTDCSAEQRADFIAVLHAASALATDAAASPTPVLISIRDTHMTQCLDYEALADASQQRHVFLDAMTEKQFKAAITQPAKAVGFTVEPALVEHLVREMRGCAGTGGPGRRPGRQAVPGLLALVSYALSETWTRRKTGKLTLNGFFAGGGLDQAVAKGADRIWARLGPDEQEMATYLLLRLIRVGHDTQDTRRRCDSLSLITHARNPAATRRVLDILANARLITLDGGCVQITHDALLRAWPWLRYQLDTDPAGNLVRQDLEDTADRWADDRDRDLLYSGSRLERACALRDSHHQLSLLAEQFLDTSTRSGNRARVLRIVAVLTSLSYVSRRQ